jgi:hypothetical protein
MAGGLRQPVPRTKLIEPAFGGQKVLEIARRGRRRNSRMEKQFARKNFGRLTRRSNALGKIRSDDGRKKQFYKYLLLFPLP